MNCDQAVSEDNQLNYGKRYSVIIPHYKDVDSLKILLYSIPERSDIQIIIVDDNTYSSKNQLSNEISGINHDYELYFNPTQVNSAGTCRNVGLTHAKGKWIVFADADDWFVEGAFDVMDRHVEEDADILFFKPISVNLPDMSVGVRHVAYEERVKKFISNRSDEISLRYCWQAPWSIMIKNSLVQKYHLSFDGVRWSNDILFSLKAGHYAKIIDAYDEVIYCITRKEGTLTSKKSEEEFLARIDVEISAWNFLRSVLDEKRVYHIIDWPVGRVIRSLLRGYGVSTAKKIINKYKNNGVKLGFKGLNKEYLHRNIIWLKNYSKDRHY